ncbi:MAG: hypothetical protein ACR2IT_08340 [Pirellulales bacterium]
MTTIMQPESSSLGRASPLVRLLAAVRWRARIWIWMESLATGALAVVAAGWMMLAIDRFIEPPAWARACLLVAAIAIVAWIVVVRLVMRLAVPLTDESLALVIERTHPEFHDGLSTAVAYARRAMAADAPDPVDPELVGRTIDAAVARVDGVRFNAIFRRRRLSLLVLAAAAAVAGSSLAAAAWPALAAIGARRLILFVDDPWPRRVQFEIEGFPDGVRTVARGADVDVVVLARAAVLPEVVELRTRAAGGWRHDRMGMRGGGTAAGQAFGHVLKGVAADLDVEVRGGDGRLRGLRIVVADPPAVADVRIVATLPDYLGGGLREIAASRVVRIPRGSSIEIECASTKPLAAATLAVRPMAGSGDAAGEAPLEQILAMLDRPAGAPRSLAARIPPLDADRVVLARLTDTSGLVNRDPVLVTLSAVPDERPQVSLRLVGISSAVTPQAVLAIEGTISDDHALGNAAVHLASGDLERQVPLPEVRGGEPLVEFPMDRPVRLPLAELGLAVGSRLEVTVSARDQCTLDGEPQESQGDTWTLDVVSPESLRALLEAREILLRRRFEAVIDDLAKARDRLAADHDGVTTAAVAWCGEAAARAAGETAEIAQEFRGIRLELATNGLLTSELEARLVSQIAKPLAMIVEKELAAAAGACRGDQPERRPTVVPLVDAALARLRAVLERMLELESVNEVIERLRGVIRLQEKIRSDTLERQRERGREALESP